MKKEIHPSSYRSVVFKDISTDYSFLSKSTANSKEMVTWEDGNTYPLVKLEISSASHPFFTGKMAFVDTAGRIDKFNKKFAKFKTPASSAADFDKQLMDLATEYTTGRGEYRISKDEVEGLFSAAIAAGINDNKIKTLKHNRATYTFTDASAQLFEEKIAAL